MLSMTTKRARIMDLTYYIDSTQLENSTPEECLAYAKTHAHTPLEHIALAWHALKTGDTEDLKRQVVQAIADYEARQAYNYAWCVIRNNGFHCLDEADKASDERYAAVRKQVKRQITKIMRAKV